MVGNGSRTNPSATDTYAGVVLRETVCIMFLYAALHGMDIWSADITNAFIQAPTTEKVFIKCCHAFGDHEGYYAIVVRALYGLNTAAASFWNHLNDCMRTMGFSSCKGDPDSFMRAYVRPDTGEELYEYILLYVGDDDNLYF